jgi:shikimate kinase
MKIYLIGLKNSGKTTTGKKLAKKLNLEFIDLDDLIEKNNGKAVTEIFSSEGEDVFRKKEQEALKQTASMEQVVISTGGGAPRFFDNMEFMKNNGTTIYLRLDEDTLVGRLKLAAIDRPVVKGKSPEEIRKYVQNILNNHEHIYMQANIVVDSKNLAPDDLVEKVLKNYSS